MKAIVKFLFLIGIFQSYNANSQVNFFWEPYAIHTYESIADAQNDSVLYSLSFNSNGVADYITWRLYLEFDLTDDIDSIPEQVVSISGELNDLETGVEPLFINFDCCPFQHSLGNVTPAGINPITYEFVPSLEYDSWVTLGVEDSSSEGASCLSTIGADWENDFENNCELIIDDFFGGGWYNIPPQPTPCPNGQTDINDRVLIGQFTVPIGCVLEEAQICLYYWVDADDQPGIFQTEVVDCVVITEPSACFTNPLYSEVISLESNSCHAGCTGSVIVSAIGGSEDISITIDAPGAIEEGPGHFSGLCADTFLVTITDNAVFDTEGNPCVIYEEVIITEPDSFIESDVSVIQEIQCFGGSDGIVQIEVTGGSPFSIGQHYFISSNQGSSAEIVSSNVFQFDSLDASSEIIFYMTDSLNCIHETSISLVQPTDFIIELSSENISCLDYNDGSITAVVTGDNTIINYCLNGDCNGTGEFLNLSEGSYLFTGNDSLGCAFSMTDSIVISAPTEMEILSLITTSPDCGGENNASVSVVVDGGTPGYSYSWNGSPFTTLSSHTGLYAGTHSLEINDQNGCSFMTDFSIAEAEELIITASLTNTTCTGMCDGTFLAVPSGGTGSLLFNFDDFSNDMACEGEFVLSVTDSLGCSETDTLVIQADIISNIEYTIFTTPVTCWNERDGTATIAVTGGSGQISYLWSDVNNQVTATAIGLLEDYYTVTITDEMGCSYTEDLYIEPTEGCFFIANALTPNSDGYNDDWTIGGLEYFPNAKVEVFNRWGQQVFESKNNYTGWNGQYNSNRLPTGDYYYVITFDPDVSPLTGTVTLKY